MAKPISDTSIQDAPVQWFEERLFAVFGLRGGPREQMLYSLLLAVTTWLASFVTLGVSILFALLFTATFFIGLARFLYAKVM